MLDSSPTTDLSGVTWGIQIDNADLTDDQEWFRVENALFEGQDIGGTAIWNSPLITISAYSNIMFSLDVAELGPHEAASDFLDIAYTVDGTSYQQLPNWNGLGNANHTFVGDFTQATVFLTGLSGTSFGLRVTMRNNAADEKLRFDNVKVTGVLSSSVPADLQQLFLADFESPISYTTNKPECTNNSGSHFIRTDGGNINPNSVYNNKQGSSFFAAENIGVTPCSAETTASLTFPPINIAGYKDLILYAFMAEDDSNDGEEDWDGTSLFYIEASFDGGAYTKVLQVASEGGTNTIPRIDANFDGIGEGTSLSSIFTEFLATLPTRGSTLSLRITMEGLNNADEDIAFDNIRVMGASANIDPAGANSFYTLDFENSGGYTSNKSECANTSGDHFTRTNGSDITTDTHYNNLQGSFYFSAQDMNAAPCDGNDLATLTIDQIDITGRTDLHFFIYLAEDDSSDGQEDWDNNSRFYVEYSIDGGDFIKILQVANQGSDNSEPAIDANFDGIGEGTKISHTFNEFTAAIPATGSQLTLRLSVEKLNDGDEDIAFDNIRLTTTSPVVENPVQNINTTFCSVESSTLNLHTVFADAGTADSQLVYATSTTDATVAAVSAVNPANGILTLTYGKVGSATITLQATDVNGNSISTSFTVTVSQAPTSSVQLTLQGLTQPYTGNPLEVFVTANNTPCKPYLIEVTYDGSVNKPTEIGSYSVVATLTDGNYLNSQSVTVSGTFNIVEASISAPTVTTTTLSATSVRLTWGAIAGASYYEIRRKQLIEGIVVNAFFGNVTATTFTDTSLAAGTTYEYEVRAVQNL